MLDLGASHNSMSKAVVECLGLDIMRPYKYISIPIDIKPPVGAGKHHFADYFDSDFAFLIRERKLENIESMNKDAIEVEVSLTASGK